MSDEVKLSAVEIQKEESRQLRGTIAEELSPDIECFSGANTGYLKHHGTYQQDNRDERGGDADRDADPGPPDEPGQHVAAELVGAEPGAMGEGRQEAVRRGGDVGIGERQDGGEERDAHDSDDDGEADDGEPVAAEPGPGGGAAGK